MNNCIFHPHLPQIVTSGVERCVTVHSPTRAAPNMEFNLTDPNVRALPESNSDLLSRYAQALIEGPGLQDGCEAVEEQRTLDFFDGSVIVILSVWLVLFILLLILRVIREHEGIDVFISSYGGGDSDSD